MTRHLHRAQKYTLLLLLCWSISLSTLSAQCNFEGPILVEEVQIGNLLTWSMHCESENIRVQIQKSGDGVHFQTIGDLGSQPLDNPESEFRYLDFALGATHSYYRIQLQEPDGQTWITPTIYLRRDTPNNISISGMSPTATDSYFNFTVRSTLAAEGSLQLWTFEPREQIINLPIALVPGGNLLSLDFTNLDTGVYLIKVIAEGEVEEVILQKVEPRDIIATSYIVKE